MDDAVWLLEFISRTKGAEHLKLSSRNLNLIQYLSIDILLFLYLILQTVIVLFKQLFTRSVQKQKQLIKKKTE